MPGTEKILSLKKLEKKAIKEALKVTRGNIKRAAEMLGISRGTLYRKLDKYNIKVPYRRTKEEE